MPCQLAPRRPLFSPHGAERAAVKNQSAEVTKAEARGRRPRPRNIIERKGVTNRPEDLARDRERIMQGLTETKAVQGLAGTFGFNKDRDGVKDVYVVMVKSGRWTHVDFAPATPS